MIQEAIQEVINSNYNLDTPVIDQLLKIHTLKTKDGVVINDTLTKGQKIIMECIVTRRSPNKDARNRVQIECITRYGKSMCIGAALAMRASGKRDSWAIIAPTQDKAQIIMDYSITFATNDPIMRANLVMDPEEFSKIDKLKEHKSKNHLTFKRGGEIRAFTSGKDGEQLMGFGSKNVVMDECYLIDDNTNSKALRMLGDSPYDNFLMKIGNPFNRGHGYDSRIDPLYFTLILDYKIALIENRLSPQLLEEMRSKPNFGVLYECLPPEADAVDSKGYFPLFSDALLKKAMIPKDAIKGFGRKRSGCDISDGGDNFSIVCNRWENVAKLSLRMKGVRALEFVSNVAIHCEDSHTINWDATGIGATTGQILERHPVIGYRVNSVRVGNSSSDPEKFLNLRAELYWTAKEWLESGGRLEESSQWNQLLQIKYKVAKNGTIQIISKDELRSKGIESPDDADAFSLTFAPESPDVSNIQTGGLSDNNW